MFIVGAAVCSTCHVMALYVQSIVYLCLPHLVDERTFIGSVLVALNAVLSMCLLHVNLGSRV